MKFKLTNWQFCVCCFSNLIKLRNYFYFLSLVAVNWHSSDRTMGKTRPCRRCIRNDWNSTVNEIHLQHLTERQKIIETRWISIALQKRLKTTELRLKWNIVGTKSSVSFTTSNVIYTMPTVCSFAHIFPLSSVLLFNCGATKSVARVPTSDFNSLVSVFEKKKKIRKNCIRFVSFTLLFVHDLVVLTDVGVCVADSRCAH